MDAIDHWRTVLYMGPTQTGKSLMADAVMYAYMDRGVSGIVAYDRNETAEDIFTLRIRPMIRENPALTKLWDGKEDSLKIDMLMLRACFWRVASAHNPKSLSSFPAGIYIGSEVGKWEVPKGEGDRMSYNPVEMLRGRGGAYWRKGGQRGLLESTPFNVGDFLYKEVYNPSTLILSPFHQCPHCHEWHTYTDSQIKLRKTGDEEPDHNPERIRAERDRAVFYECPHCLQEITEAQRVHQANRIIWAAGEVDEEQHKQKREAITRAGEIIGGTRDRFSQVCYNWTRLEDVAFPLWECSAQFFQAVHDPERLRVYNNETMARYYRRKTGAIQAGQVEAHAGNYRMSGEHAQVPDGALVLTAGVDTQDNGFYYAIFGWGLSMEWWLIRHGFIECDVGEPKYREKRAVLDVFQLDFPGRPLLREDGTSVPIRKIIIDRGGHRDDDVDYIAQNVPGVEAYVGLARIDTKKPMIYKSDKGEFLLGQTETLSEITGKLLTADDWHIPRDTQPDFHKQIVGQWFKNVSDTYGRMKSVWMRLKNDHYRDCFNLAYGAAWMMGVPAAMFRDGVAARIRQSELPKPKHTTPQPPVPGGPPRPQSRGGYYDRAMRGSLYGRPSR